MNTGEVGRILSRRILSNTPERAVEFYRPLLTNYRIAVLGSKAGEPLKDLCLMLDQEGNPDVFWAVWEKFAGAAVAIGSHLNDEDFWKQRKLKSGVAPAAFDSLLASVFLNRMYFGQDHDWAPIPGQLDRFRQAFRIFNAFALNKYVAFLDTVGGALLPDPFVEVSSCVANLIEKVGKSLLTHSSELRLVRLLKKHSAAAAADPSAPPSKAILHLLTVLADAGHAQAFRLRETLARNVS